MDYRESKKVKVREVSLYRKNYPDTSQNYSSTKLPEWERHYSPQIGRERFEIDQIELIEEAPYKTISNQTK